MARPSQWNPPLAIYVQYLATGYFDINAWHSVGIEIKNWNPTYSFVKSHENFLKITVEMLQ